MSGYLMGRVLAHQFERVPARPELDPNARRGCSADTLKLVMIAMCNRAGDDGTASHPGIRELAEFTQRNAGTVVIALAHLRIDEYLVRTERSDCHKADAYRVNLERLVMHRARVSETRADPDVRTVAGRAQRPYVRTSCG